MMAFVSVLDLRLRQARVQGLRRLAEPAGASRPPDRRPRAVARSDVTEAGHTCREQSHRPTVVEPREADGADEPPVDAGRRRARAADGRRRRRRRTSRRRTPTPTPTTPTADGRGRRRGRRRRRRPRSPTRPSRRRRPPTADPVEEFRARAAPQPGDWYVVHSYAGYENRVKANLETRITSPSTWRTTSTRSRSPRRRSPRSRTASASWSSATVLPGYVLVRMDLTDESWARRPPHPGRHRLRRPHPPAGAR